MCTYIYTYTYLSHLAGLVKQATGYRSLIHDKDEETFSKHFSSLLSPKETSSTSTGLCPVELLAKGIPWKFTPPHAE